MTTSQCVPIPPIRVDEAQILIAQIEDPVVRNLVSLCVAQVYQRLLRPVELSVEEWQSRQPATAVDLAFFVSVMQRTFELKAIVANIQRGQALSEATGWGADCAEDWGPE